MMYSGCWCILSALAGSGAFISGRLNVVQCGSGGLSPVVTTTSMKCLFPSLPPQTTGFTGADLANLVNEAALLAGRGNKGEAPLI